MEKLILMPENEVRELMIAALAEYERLKQGKDSEPLYTINQVAKKLQKAHATIKKWVENGVLRTTENGLIPKSEIERFLSVQ